MIYRYLGKDVDDMPMADFVHEVARAKVVQQLEINTMARAIVEALGEEKPT